MHAIKNKTKKLIVISILLVLTSLVTFTRYHQNNSLKEYPSVNIDKEIKKADIVWVYNLTGGTGITIDDSNPSNNWTVNADAFDWITGNGTLGNPYEIRYLWFDGLGQDINLITIKNSDAVFRIEDCILSNTYYDDWDETTCNAIYLENVENGIISNVDTSDCMNGIRLKNSERNTILRTFASEHHTSGIVISGGSNNIIRNNTIFKDNGIRLTDGTYNNDVEENIITNGRIHLSGSHYNNITSNVISNRSSSSGINLEYSDYNNVSGNTLTHCGIGLKVEDSDNNIISANLVLDSNHPWYDLEELVMEYADIGIGLQIGESSWNTVSKNNISGSRLIGILIEDSDNHSIWENIVANSGFDDIYLINTPAIELSQNKMYGSGLYFQIRNSDLEGINIEPTNLVNNKPIYFYVNETGLDQADFINGGQVFLFDCEDIFISGLQFDNVSTGITLQHCSNSVISSSQASYNSRWGFGVFNCSKTRLIGSTASNCKKSGITFEESDINYISGNTASFNHEDGIKLSNTHHGLIINNIANDNDGTGISLKGDSPHNVWNGTQWVEVTFTCLNNSLISNEVDHNNEYGIELYYVDVFLVTGNTAKRSADGIYVYEFESGIITENEVIGNVIGLALESGSDLYVSNNTAKSNAEIRYGSIRGGAGIDISSCSGVVVNENELIGNARGLSISHCITGEVKDNYVKRNGWEEGFWIFQNTPSGDTGIYFYLSDYFNVTENILDENGIGLSACDNNSLFLNQINDFGFVLSGCDWNLISGNLITNAIIAIDLGGCSYNNITFNIIIAQQCFREKGCVANVFEGNDCTEVAPDPHIREILSIVGLASVLVLNVPLFLKKRKKRK